MFCFSIFSLNACVCLCVNLFALLFSDSVCTHPNPWRSCFTAEELLGVLLQSPSVCPNEGERGPVWAPVCECRWLTCHQKVETGGTWFQGNTSCSIAQSGASVSGNWEETWDQAQKHIPSLPLGLAFLFDVRVNTEGQPVANVGHCLTQNRQDPHPI